MTCLALGTGHCWDPTKEVELRVVRDDYGPHAHSYNLQKLTQKRESVLVYMRYKVRNEGALTLFPERAAFEVVCVCGDSVRDVRGTFRPMSKFVEGSMKVDSNYLPELHDYYCQHYLKGVRMDPVRLLASTPC